MLYSLSPPRILISFCQPLTSLSSVSHPSPISTSILLFFFFYHSFFIALSIPSILLPARLHLFFLTSLSFLPVFQPWLFPPSFTVILTFSRPISLTFLALLFFPLCPSFCFSALPNPHHHLSLYLFLEYVIFHTSQRHLSLADPVSIRSPFLFLLTSLCQLITNHENGPLTPHYH